MDATWFHGIGYGALGQMPQSYKGIHGNGTGTCVIYGNGQTIAGGNAGGRRQVTQGTISSTGSATWSYKTSKNTMISALALAGDAVIAGAVDVAGTKGYLYVLSAKNGEVLFETELDARPVVSGIAVYDGKVYVSTYDGTVICFAPVSGSAA